MKQELKEKFEAIAIEYIPYFGSTGTEEEIISALEAAYKMRDEQLNKLRGALQEIKDCFDGNGTINTIWLENHVTQAILTTH